MLLVVCHLERPLSTVSLCQLSSTAVLQSSVSRSPRGCHLWGILAAPTRLAPSSHLPRRARQLGGCVPAPQSRFLSSGAPVFLGMATGCGLCFLISLQPSKPWKRPGGDPCFTQVMRWWWKSCRSGIQAHGCACSLLGLTQLPAGTLVHAAQHAGLPLSTSDFCLGEPRGL